MSFLKSTSQKAEVACVHQTKDLSTKVYSAKPLVKSGVYSLWTARIHIIEQHQKQHGLLFKRHPRRSRDWVHPLLMSKAQLTCEASSFFDGNDHTAHGTKDGSKSWAVQRAAGRNGRLDGREEFGRQDFKAGVTPRICFLFLSRGTSHGTSGNVAGLPGTKKGGSYLWRSAGMSSKCRVNVL